VGTFRDINENDLGQNWEHLALFMCYDSNGHHLGPGVAGWLAQVTPGYWRAWFLTPLRLVVGMCPPFILRTKHHIGAFLFGVDSVRIVKMNINEIDPAHYNPRKDLKPGDPEYNRIKQSILEFDLVEPLVWNERTRRLVSGHQRLKVLRELGYKTVDVSVVDLPEDKERVLNIALNKIQGDWDFVKLKEVFEELPEESFDLTGFDWSEIEQMFKTIGEAEDQETEDEAPQVERRASVGDIWRLGRHFVACGDCTDLALLDRLFDGAKANTVVTSPPYAEQRKSTYGGVPADKYVDWFADVANAVYSVLDEAGSFFINIKEHVEDGQRSLYVMKLVIAMVERFGWRFIDELVWVKPGVPGGWTNRLKNDFEPVFWFAKSDEVDVVEQEVEEGEAESFLIDEFGRAFHFSKQRKIRFYPKSVGKESDRVKVYTRANKNKTANKNVGVVGPHKKGIARPGNVIRVSVNNEAWGHPAMYPVGLAEFLIKLTTLKGDRVFDPFLGSGTTLIAAERTGRTCYGTELMPEYVDIILARWESETGERAVRIYGGDLGAATR